MTEHTLPRCTGNNSILKTPLSRHKKTAPPQSQLPLWELLLYSNIAQWFVRCCSISNDTKGKLGKLCNLHIGCALTEPSTHRSVKTGHAVPWKLRVFGDHKNSHYWHSCLYPRSTKRSYKNNEVQQAQNKKGVSAVNSMECLTQRSLLIFLWVQNVLKQHLI